jgi:tetratricopeptide (TPR) repeat protein
MSDPVPSKDRNAEVPKQGGKTGARPARRASMFDDPVVRILGFVVLGVVILYLAAVASALVVGVIGSPAPRTAAERDLADAQSVVNAGDQSAPAIAAYVNALIGVEQFGQAQNVIDSAPNTAKSSPLGEIPLAQTTLYYVQKDYTRAVRAADVTLKLIKTNYEADLKKPGMNQSKSYGLNDNYYSALLLKGLSQQALGDSKDALATYNEYLVKNPMESNILVYRGQVKALLKDPAGALADYKTALKFDPTNQLALDELKKIGAK